jgi:hypothetical protein
MPIFGSLIPPNNKMKQDGERGGCSFIDAEPITFRTKHYILTDLKTN